ncbi:uncharacterized protein LOC143368073 [Andrena cerasifolii]|uniref:uncharacterized protein LOC143368073 n=1 Tax=Andrena cerasifolii TaxID=2819439 RepID=UPI004037F8EB
MSKESGVDSNIARSNTAFTSSAIENESSSDSSLLSPPARKTCRRRQAFRQAWLEDPEFKSWLQQCDDPYKAKCIVCSKIFVGSKSDLQKHKKTIIHNIKMQNRELEERQEREEVH